jgi:hypothetical protein
MIAPIVIGTAVILYYTIFFLTVIHLPMPIYLKLIFGIVPILLSGVMISVVWSRIKEIKGGEEDDLSKY